MGYAENVKPGQIYEDGGGRRRASPREIIVVSVYGRYAHCLSFDLKTRESREVKIQTSRLGRQGRRYFKLKRQYSGPGPGKDPCASDER